MHSFSLVRKDSGAVIGQCGFKGPPDADGTVEIAYGVSPDQEGNGFATEAARALRDYALTFEQVQTVCAHTLAVTTLGTTRPGDRVNIEVDILAKHVQKLLGK